MVSTAESLPDPQSLWETAQLEIALEGSNGCSLDRLWELVKLVEPTNHSEKEGRDDKEPSPTTFLRRWLWRWVFPCITAERGNFCIEYYSECLNGSLKRRPVGFHAVSERHGYGQYLNNTLTPHWCDMKGGARSGLDFQTAYSCNHRLYTVFKITKTLVQVAGSRFPGLGEMS